MILEILLSLVAFVVAATIAMSVLFLALAFVGWLMQESGRKQVAPTSRHERGGGEAVEAARAEARGPRACAIRSARRDLLASTEPDAVLVFLEAIDEAFELPVEEALSDILPVRARDGMVRPTDPQQSFIDAEKAAKRALKARGRTCEQVEVTRLGSLEREWMDGHLS